ncbi:hypothetical protein [Limnoglobus roseus]|uniref:Uncharacterized protein n=1 Tax=Limnoglobus roseus TaxID=2598579 RepID=A0A5C1ANS1_9BACT|nr:hypothetical protein [Limnoglobus roseus]QEL18864.1 hypothetical protein PX52LOC_05906 [Limnoglobus roseus]
MDQRARELHQRSNELERAECRYADLVPRLAEFFDKLADSEFGHKIGRDVLARVEQVLGEEIRPQRRDTWDQYVALFGFTWNDVVRVDNAGETPVEMAPSHMNFAPFHIEPFAWLHGWALKADGQPGKKVLVAKLRPGVTIVRVLRRGQGTPKQASPVPAAS